MVADESIREQMQADWEMGVLDQTEHKHIRLLIAANPSTPATVLDHLAKTHGCDVELLERIATNCRTGAGTLRYLSSSKFSSVRLSVAENTNAALPILALLASDPCDDVRYSLAENPHVPVDLLHHLTADNNPFVSQRASRTLARIRGGQVIEREFSHNSTSSIGRKSESC